MRLYKFNSTRKILWENVQRDLEVVSSIPALGSSQYYEKIVMFSIFLFRV